MARKKRRGSILGGLISVLFAGGRTSAGRGELPSKKRRNPSDLTKAKRMSREFHCTPDETRRLSEAERKPLPKEVMVVGEVHEITYGPDRHSCRGTSLWRHVFGDRGAGKPKAKEKPLLVASPNGQIAIVQGKSPAKLDPKKGIVG